mmetsp:Transcript_2055/g.4698  ORF Transcript_2055/g.4698 Transcript_2055/m.4698 type:complete len:321 (+) Transcript_2055:424-1386(+)
MDLCIFIMACRFAGLVSLLRNSGLRSISLIWGFASIIARVSGFADIIASNAPGWDSIEFIMLCIWGSSNMLWMASIPKAPPKSPPPSLFPPLPLLLLLLPVPAPVPARGPPRPPKPLPSCPSNDSKPPKPCWALRLAPACCRSPPAAQGLGSGDVLGGAALFPPLRRASKGFAPATLPPPWLPLTSPPWPDSRLSSPVASLLAPVFAGFALPPPLMEDMLLSGSWKFSYMRRRWLKPSGRDSMLLIARSAVRICSRIRLGLRAIAMDWRRVSGSFKTWESSGLRSIHSLSCGFALIIVRMTSGSLMICSIAGEFIISSSR